MRHSEAALATEDGATLWVRDWQPEEAPPRAAGVLVHGLGEHGGRYEHLARRLTDAGYALDAFDLRGHGRSSGRRGDTRIEPALGDVERLLARAGARHPGLPLFLYGHSLGALVVLTALVRRRPRVAAAILSAPPLRNALREQRVKVLLARALGGLLPWLTLRAGLEAAALSRDPGVVAAYLADPLVHGSASLGLARDSLAATEAVESACDLALPLLILHGGADRIAYPAGSRALAARLAGDVSLREYPGLFHEPHNEPERDAVIEDAIAWLDARVGPRAAASPGGRRMAP
ncbi:MAG: lysophospholipase [Betaproteobacteria bacterium]